MTAEFKARIGQDVPKEGETRVVFSIRTARGNRLELDGVFDEAVALKAWTSLCENQLKCAAGRQLDGRTHDEFPRGDR